MHNGQQVGCASELCILSASMPDFWCYMLQQAGVIEALHTEIGHTKAALEQLQQEQLQHANFLASYNDQVQLLASPPS